jgi:hypothetical protein
MPWGGVWRERRFAPADQHLSSSFVHARSQKA